MWSRVMLSTGIDIIGETMRNKNKIIITGVIVMQQILYYRVIRKYGPGGFKKSSLNFYFVDFRVWGQIEIVNRLTHLQRSRYHIRSTCQLQLFHLHIYHNLLSVIPAFTNPFFMQFSLILLYINRYRPGNGNRGRGYFWYTPLAENFSKIPPPPPGDSGSSRHFSFLNERKTLKFTLI